MRVMIEVDSALIQAVQPGTINIVLAQGTVVKAQIGDDPDNRNWKQVPPAVLTRHLKRNQKPDLVLPRLLRAKDAEKLVQIGKVK